MVGSRLGALAGLLLFSCGAAVLSPPALGAELPKADEIVVLKSERRLMLMRQGEAFRTYRVALGLKPVGDKQERGDARTPEGEYLIDERKADSRFHRALHISYPDERDREEARARGVNPGGAIMIHGLPPERAKLGGDHALWDWTNGCIAVSNREMDEIWRAVDVGTPISIRP